MKGLLLFSSILCSFALKAQSATQISQTVTTEIDSIVSLKKRVPFYKITKPNCPESYLMGTIHIIPSKYNPTIDDVTPFLLKTKELYLEVANLSDIKPEYYLLGKNEKDFLSYFTEEQKDSIFEYSETLCDIPKATLIANSMFFKPMIISQLLTKPFASGDYSYDLAINNFALNSNIKIKGLEKIEEQLKILGNQDSLSLNKSTLELIRNPIKTTNAYNSLVYHYFNTDIDALEKAMRLEMDDPVFLYELLDKRNLKWIKTLKKELTKKALFIAVGAGHLAGENGLIKLLVNEGFTVTKIEL